MKKKIDNEKSVRIYTRIYDEKTLSKIDKLVAEERFASKSEVVSKCVELALPLLLEGRTDTEKKNDVADALKKQSATIRELSVITNIAFNLIQSLFTERALTLSGKVTNCHDMQDGVYEQLPEHYQDILSELLK